MIKGCDLSQFQGQPNFDSLKGLVDFAIIRSTYGNGYTDPQFIRNQSEARRVGLLLGYYHYSYPQYNSAQDEANWMLSQLKNIQNGEVIFLDFEEKYTGDVVAWCKTFLDTISTNLNGYKALIYLNLSEIKSYNWQPVIDANYGLWLADYDGNSTGTPDTPWPVVAFKQWEDNEQLSGISGNVDADVFFGDDTAFKAYGVKLTVPQTPQPQILTDDEQRALSVLEDAQKTIVLTDGSHYGNTESVARAGTGAIVALTNAQSDLKSANDTITQLKDLVSTLQGADDSEKETITKLQDQLTTLQSQLTQASQNAAQPIQFHNQWAKIAYSVFQALNG